MKLKFESKFKELEKVILPPFSNTRVMMMPLILGDLNSIPESLAHYKSTLSELFHLMDQNHKGKIGYLTIDEKFIKKGDTHRRSGLHVDGVFNDSCGGWGGGGGWGSVGNGMITVASEQGCKAYNQALEGVIGEDGECDLLKDKLKEENATIFKKNTAYWVDGLCVHESIQQEKDVNRTFLRLSMPSKAPWFKGYTKNPLGIKPTGKILDMREYQISKEVKLKT